MSLRPDPTDPATMTAEERRDEAASILARGVLRLQGRALAGAANVAIREESSPPRLELVACSDPDGAAG